jgi:hypothetical protein
MLLTGAVGNGLSLDPFRGRCDECRVAAQSGSDVTRRDATRLRTGSRQSNSNMQDSIRFISQAFNMVGAPSLGQQSGDEGCMHGLLSTRSHDSVGEARRASRTCSAGGTVMGSSNCAIYLLHPAGVETSLRKGSSTAVMRGCGRTMPRTWGVGLGMCRLGRFDEYSHGKDGRGQQTETWRRRAHDPGACSSACGRRRDGPAGVAGWT